jgi:hypothetical protein
MLRPLLIILLLIGLSLPAMAMTGHCTMAAAAPMAQNHHHDGNGKQAPAKTSSLGDCIGCVTPPNGAGAKFKAPAPVVATHALTNDASLLAAALEPATPPPQA